MSGFPEGVNSGGLPLLKVLYKTKMQRRSQEIKFSIRFPILYSVVRHVVLNGSPFVVLIICLDLLPRSHAVTTVHDILKRDNLRK